jgi:hypothetical protein
VCRRGLAAFHQKHMEVRGQRLGVKLSHHQCDLTSMVSGMVRQMLHEVRQSDLCRAKGKHFFKDSFVTRFTNSACSFSTSTHFDFTAPTLGNSSGLLGRPVAFSSLTRGWSYGAAPSNTQAKSTRRR